MTQPARTLLKERVLPAVERQADLYDRLAAFGPRQDALIATGDGEGLLRLLGERQEVVDELVRVHEGIADVREQWDRFVEGLPEDERAELARRLDELKAIAGRVDAQDSRSGADLRAASERVSGEVGQLNRSRGAMRAYAAAPAAAPRHQDRQA
ncbi:MAG: hypothetical protein AAFX79_00580 [Planctomycetota bacterium]